MSAPGTVRIVVRREFVERIRDRGFLVSTGVTLFFIIVFILASAFFSRSSSYDLAVVGEDSRALGEQVVRVAAGVDVEVGLHPYATSAAAAQAVRDGQEDAALVDADRILVKSDPPADLVGAIQQVSSRDRSEQALADAGLASEQVSDALTQAPLPVRALEPRDDRARENAAIAFIGVLALYGQLFAYGYWVAAGVVEEKSSRVVEVLLATVRPSQLLRGKILGIGVLGLFQLLLIGAVGFATAELTGALRFPVGAVGAIGVVLVWFVVGFFFYASLFAVAGSIVSRQEDLQSTMTPLTIVIVASFFVGIAATGNPSSTLALVASLLPPSAPLVMPTRIVLGEATWWQAALSIALSVGGTIALIPVATKAYSRGALRTSRTRLRQLLRADRRG